MRDILKRSVSMKAFIAAIVIMAALAFGASYAATSVFITPSPVFQEIRGIRYEITGKVEITAIDIVFDDADDLWHVLVDGSVKITAANGTYTLTPTITAPAGAAPVTEASAEVEHLTSGTAATPFTDADIGTLGDYPTGNYLILVKATKTA